MSLRTKSKTPTQNPTIQGSDGDVVDQQRRPPQPAAATPTRPPPPSQPRRSPPQQALSQAFASTASLANLLPTGTLLAFQMLTPVFTNNGACDSVTRASTLVILLLLAASCFLACFTDSIRCADGTIYYGMATPRGLWLFDCPADAPPPIKDISRYRLRAIDVVHAVLSVLVFASVALRDRNVVKCFYPHPQHETEEVLDIVPLGVGAISSLLFMVFPTRRHGIGYPVSANRDEQPSS